MTRVRELACLAAWLCFPAAVPAQETVAATAGPIELEKVFPVKPGEWPLWGGNPARNM
jgi:hypothetical protein